jgi:hypothetical protein
MKMKREQQQFQVRVTVYSTLFYFEIVVGGNFEFSDFFGMKLER